MRRGAGGELPRAVPPPSELRLLPVMFSVCAFVSLCSVVFYLLLLLRLVETCRSVLCLSSERLFEQLMFLLAQQIDRGVQSSGKIIKDN